MTKIWQKHNTQVLNTRIENYTVGEDYILDQHLLPYDIVASKAHATMLQHIGLLTKEESEKLIIGLSEIEKLHKQGNFPITQTQEDGHTAVEEYLTNTYGEVGKKIHTGRSRNDQVLVATRLWMIVQLQEVHQKIEDLILSFQDKKDLYKDIVMPGYTHMQRAMPSSVAMWLDSFASALKDDLIVLKASADVINQNPLGSVAGYGETNLGLDRNLTTHLMGFKKVQENPMYCAYSRGKFDLIVMQALSQVMLDLGKFSSDMLLFTTKEFDFFDVDDSFKTGSSVMPQKKNYDIFEIVRGNVGIYLGYMFQIQEVIKNLYSGYNRDFQLTKKPLIHGVLLVAQTIEVVNLAVKSLTVKQEHLANACSSELYATEKAYELVKNGMSFRDAYKQVGQKYL